MEEEKVSYFEKQLDATLVKNEHSYTITFQKTRLKLHDPLEIHFLIDSDSLIDRDLETTEDTIEIIVKPNESLHDFALIHSKDTYAKWLLIDQLLKKVQQHSLTRLNLFICPENILFDESFEPYFLHYGVAESLPPYYIDQESSFQELKATLATIIDPKYTFKEYLSYSQTLRLTGPAKELMDSKSTNEILFITQEAISTIEAESKEQVHIKRKNWLINRYLLIGSFVILVPLMALTIYGYWFFIPEKNAYIKSSEHYINADFSSVINELESYKAERMPYVVQYELANAYLATESLTEEQRENLQRTITLQSNESVFHYWIHLGRGENEEAIEIARSMEYELVVLGLLKYKDEITNDQSLNSEEREQLLSETQSELDSFIDEREQQREQEESEEQDQEADAEVTEEQPDDNQEEAEEQENNEENNDEEENEEEGDEENDEE
ncbi:type VII secretion protein EssB [Alkalicoccobacillus murimartini]|uniref:Type VII secretion protein EssB n=1 Tax=Alkalicoccobacillus murimartini TaxID=171685 RepID=A0ABT9YKV9_9BACI|nr:type VII secretion protein EssB [Alkalicoccobacillus murimartini]MDQ0208510.1 type VII secretion protein EssB [Alkalicoccobacillus murimartini]